MFAWKMTLVALTVTLLGVPAPADHNLEELTEAFEQAEARWFESMESKESPVWKTHPVREFMPRFRKIAEAEAGKPAAFDALLWMLMNMQPLRAADGDAAAEKTTAWVMKRLTRDHAAGLSLDDLSERLQFLAYGTHLDLLVPYYEAVIENCKDDESKAYATFNLAAALFSPLSMRGMLPDPKRLKADRERAKGLFYHISKDYPGTKAAEAAKPYIFEIEHLQVGHAAPEITGKDPEGKEIRLSQFRGQVVVLDFWGFW